MHQTNPVAITGDSVRKMRQDMNLSQRAFWERIGCTVPTGCGYETGRSRIPEPVRRLIYLQYVLGIPTDIDSQEFREFESGMNNNNPSRLITARRVLETGIDIMSNTLRELNND